ncbi:hypothetical protein RIF29_38472 [Crotalaria pallida]|uniref:Serine aminopeptidase S33 domain-containing protein n=1 Tax=Crotalaria pallida TaxID=3830 RepID=A0AAN9DZ98_CROPI
MELALALERAWGGHEFESDGLSRREGGFVDGAEAAVAEFGGGGEGVGGAAEDRESLRHPRTKPSNRGEPRFFLPLVRDSSLGALKSLSSHLRHRSLLVCLTRYDYSGYGQSTGKPSGQNTYADIEAAYKCLEESYGAKQEDIILYGQSVGSGPTLDLVARLPQLRAVVLHSPILSGLRVMYPVRRSYWFDISSKAVVPLWYCF